MPTTTTGAWSLSEVLEQLRKNEWITYNSGNDPNDIWTWGVNASGELAINNNLNRSSPVQVPGQFWCSASVGENFLASRCDGTLWLAGTNAFAQSGSDTPANISSPVQIPGTTWKKVQATSNQASLFAIRTDGTLWAWGENSIGNLAQSDLINRSSPVQIPGTNWSDVRSYASHVMALKTDNTLWAWGTNSNGQLGQNDRVHRSSPVQIPGTTWCKIAVGCCFSYAIKSDNTLWAWGTNSNGQLGQNDRVHRSSPVQIPGTTWCDVSAGLATALAIRTDNTLWGMGGSSNGELGVLVVTSRSSPVQIPGTTWCCLPCSYTHLSSYAIKTDDTLWVWGFNNAGHLGTNDITNKSSPVQVPGTTWKYITTGSGRTIGTKKL